LKIKIFAKIIFIIVAGTVLVACSYYNSKLEKNPPSQRQHFCSGIKQQLIFNQTTIGATSTQLDISQKSDLERQYQKYNCDKLD
jgi:hypothetical protein